MKFCPTKFKIIAFGLIIAVSFLMTITFLKYGIPVNHDTVTNFSFAKTVYDSLSQGNIYITGEPQANLEYGGYALRFYPNLTHYTLAIAYFFTQNWFHAAFIFFWFWMAVGGFGLFLLAREWLDERFALIASILYLIEPYHNTQINLTFAYAEFAAGCLLTFCFLFMTRIIKSGKWFDVLGLGIFYGLLILCHIPLTLIGSIGLGIYGFILLIYSENKITNLTKLASGIFLGILAASFHLIRVFSELEWIQHSQSKFLYAEKFSYQRHFVDVKSFLFSNDLVLYNFLILLIPPAVLILLKCEKETKRKFYPILAITAFSLFLSTSYSKFIWETFPILQDVQFPWRWFTLASIGYGIIIAASILPLFNLLEGKKLVPVFWTCFFITASAFFTINWIIGANLIDPEFMLVKNEEFNREITHNFNGVYLNFWQTVWTKQSAFQIKEKVLAENRNAEIVRWDNYRKEIKVFEGQPTNVRLAISYYPHWKATVNGENTEVLKTDDGAILVPVSENESVIEIKFVEPFLIRFFQVISAVTWLGFLLALLLNLQRKVRFKPVPV